MSSHIMKVLKQALKTFSLKKRNAESLSANFQALIALLDKTTAEHVNFPPHFMDPKLWDDPEKAPVSCIEIFEDDQLTMGIFILKPNGKLPLHNHPQMHGLIKVIAGQVKIVSYSVNTDKTREFDQKNIEHTPFKRPDRYEIITAELNGVTIANSESPTCALEPEFKNIHEIQSLDGPAAFIDVLAPPYDYPLPGFGSRRCSYYSRLSQLAPTIFKLQEIRSPSWYWTDSHPYTGPDLYEDEELSS